LTPGTADGASPFMSVPMGLRLAKLDENRRLAHQSEALRSWDVKTRCDAQIRCAPATVEECAVERAARYSAVLN
jgi:hypothetical protein